MFLFFISAVIIAVSFAALTSSLSVSLMERASSALPYLAHSSGRGNKLMTHVAALLVPLILARYSAGSFYMSVTFFFVAALMWLLASIDLQYKLVPESLIFVLSIVCGLSTLLGQSGVRIDAAFAAMVVSALVIGLVIQVVARVQGSRTDVNDPSTLVVFGSGDTLVIIGLSAYLGMNILYALAIATILSTLYLYVHQALFPRKPTDEATPIPFLPALYVGFISTKCLEIYFSQGRIETLNSVVQHLFSFSQVRGF